MYSKHRAYSGYTVYYYSGASVPNGLLECFPYSLGEVGLFEEVNHLSPPAHIVPEWYFCVSYVILRSVPNKGGVIIMLISVVILFLYPPSPNYITPSSNESSTMWVSLLSLQVYLTYLGFAPIEQPFVLVALASTIIYILFHIAYMASNLLVSCPSILAFCSCNLGDPLHSALLVGILINNLFTTLQV